MLPRARLRAGKDFNAIVGGNISPQMVQTYFQNTWGGQATNISVSETQGGFKVSGTATSTGNSFSNYFVSTAFIQGQFDFLTENGNDISAEGKSTLDKISVGVDAFGTGWGMKEEMINYAAKLSPAINNLGYTKFVRNVGKGMIVTQVLFSVANVYSVWDSDASVSTKIGVTTKSGIDVTMVYISTLGPIGFGVAALYFLADISGIFDKSLDEIINEARNRAAGK